MSERKRTTDRQFLNEDQEMLGICAYVIEAWEMDDKSLRDVDASLSISDCSRTINLDFSLYNFDRENLKDSIRTKKEKLDKLCDMLSTFRRELYKVYDDVVPNESTD